MNSNNGITVEPVTKTSPKDFFLHLLAIAALYISAVSFGTLVFQFIDRTFPDVLTAYALQSYSTIRWAIASLVIVFPVYVILSWSLARGVTRHSEKRELKIRKWLLYFTLFLAAGVIIGDLVALIYNFLNGDLTLRFLFKAATILFIALVVFSYYLWNLRSGVMASRDRRMRVLVFGVIAIVVVATVAGFFIAGSPFAERLRRLDSQRVRDLQTIQWQVVSYWQKKDKLPENLDALTDNISGFVTPRNPESGAPYEYRVIANLKFELCSVFKSQGAEEGNNLPRAGGPYGGDMTASWQHDIGRVCFERTIDPELYGIKPLKAP